MNGTMSLPKMPLEKLRSLTKSNMQSRPVPMQPQTNVQSVTGSQDGEFKFLTNSRA